MATLKENSFLKNTFNTSPIKLVRFNSSQLRRTPTYLMIIGALSVVFSGTFYTCSTQLLTQVKCVISSASSGHQMRVKSQLASLKASKYVQCYFYFLKQQTVHVNGKENIFLRVSCPVTRATYVNEAVQTNFKIKNSVSFNR